MWWFVIAGTLRRKILPQAAKLSIEQLQFRPQLADLLIMTDCYLVECLDCIFLLGIKRLESGYLRLDILCHYSYSHLQIGHIIKIRPGFGKSCSW